MQEIVNSNKKIKSKQRDTMRDLLGNEEQVLHVSNMRLH